MRGLYKYCVLRRVTAHALPTKSAFDVRISITTTTTTLESLGIHHSGVINALFFLIMKRNEKKI